MTVKQKQWQLYFLGYYGDDLSDIDGIFGPKSVSGTLAFQKDSFRDSIAHDGIFGDSTAGKSMELVDRIQDILKTFAPNLVDDGLAGPKTMEALRQFQKTKGLPQTGRVDDATWDALMEESPSLPDREPVPEVGTTISKTETVDKGILTTGTFWDKIIYFKAQRNAL